MEEKSREIKICIAGPEDAAALLDIYAPYVENTAITFEYTVPTAEEFKKRISRVLERYPYLAAEKDGEFLGYAYVSPFHERKAYDWAVETSIYVSREKKRMGVGKKLYEALEHILAAQNILNLNACIAWPSEEDEYLTKDSVRFHERLGYRFVGEFHQCGYKFHRWYNMVWMEKSIGEHLEYQPGVKRFDEIREEMGKKYGIV